MEEIIEMTVEGGISALVLVGMLGAVWLMMFLIYIGMEMGSYIIRKAKDDGEEKIKN